MKYTTPRIKDDLPRPEIVVHPRLDIAAQLGVSVQSISQTIRIATLGDLPQNGAKFSLSDRQIPIRVSLIESARRDLSTLENLPVPTASGTSVPLKTVADLSFGQGPSAVRRYNQTRRVFLEADLSPGVELGTATKKIYALPTLKNLPQGVHLVETRQYRILARIVCRISRWPSAPVSSWCSPCWSCCSHGCSSRSRSCRRCRCPWAAPRSRCCSRPSRFRSPVVIGFLMLMGIVAKNSILLVDFAIEEMRAGKPRLEAILEAGHKRARPIVMTTVAMVAGMFPVAAAGAGTAISARRWRLRSSED